MFFKFIDITQIDWKLDFLPIEGLWCFSMFSINTFRVLFYGFNARMIAHLKRSSSSFLRLIIAFFAARNAGSGIWEEPPSGSFFTVWRSRLKSEWNLQLLPCLWNIAKDSKTISLIFRKQFVRVSTFKVDFCFRMKCCLFGYHFTTY